MKYIYLAVIFTVSSWGQLSWETMKQDIHFNKSNPELLKGAFPFKNNSDHLIEINRVKVSCGCTKVDLKKKIYLPGEKGIIPYSISLKDKTKTFTKTLTVHTHNEEPKEQVLTFKVIYPELDPVVEDEKTSVADVKSLGQQKSKTDDTKKKTISFRVFDEQIKCPFQGSAIKKSLYVDYKDKRIYTCCEECIPLVKAHPELALQKLRKMNEFAISVKMALKKLKNNQ
jgi:hypothetical protein